MTAAVAAWTEVARKAEPSWWSALPAWRPWGTARAASRKGSPVFALLDSLAEGLADRLSADDREDLLLSIDRVATSDWFLGLRMALLQELVGAKADLDAAADELEEGQLAAFLVEALGQGMRSLANQAAVLMAAHVRATVWLQDQMPGGLAPSLSDTTDAQWLATSIAVPGPLRRAFLGGLKADVCLLAASARCEALSAPWAGLALAEELVASLHDGLCLIASIPGAPVSETLIRSHERLDLDALTADLLVAERRLSSIFAAAEQSPAEPYFPFGPPLLDD